MSKNRFGKTGYYDIMGRFQPYANLGKDEAIAAAKANPPMKSGTDWKAKTPHVSNVVRPYLYFAYGSNLHHNQFKARCPASAKGEPFKLDGFKLVFKGCADIIPAEGRTVSGATYRITARCEAALDRYEGYPSLYGKRFLKINDELTIMFYVMNDTCLYRPSQYYFDTIWQGFLNWDLDTQPLMDALNEQGIATVEDLQHPVYYRTSTGNYASSDPYLGGHGGFGWDSYNRRSSSTGRIGTSWYKDGEDEPLDYSSDEYWERVLGGELDD